MIPGSDQYDNEDAFDGEFLWNRRRDSILKTPLADASSVMHFRILEWPWLDAAGIFAPGFVPEVQAFSSLEPLSLHYLDHSDSAKLETVGDNPRLTFQVVDPQIVEIQKVDIDTYRDELQRTPNTKEWIADEIEDVKRFKAMKPTRTVTLLLDAKHGYAVAEREEWTATGERIVHIVSDAWKFYEGPGIWLPGRCVASHYARPYALKDFSKEPIHTVTHELKRVEFGHKDIRFALDPNSPAAVPGSDVPRAGRGQ
jgi:hypothetical protein